jgi:hypothetical protein
VGGTTRKGNSAEIDFAQPINYSLLNPLFGNRQAIKIFPFYLIDSPSICGAQQ